MGGPITERFSTAAAHGVDETVLFEPTWFMRNYGCEFPDPMVSDPELLEELHMQRQRILHERFPDVRLGSPDPSLPSLIDWPDCGQLVQLAFGGSRPEWIPESGAWWHDRHFCPWAEVQNVDDVRSIKGASVGKRTGNRSPLLPR